MLRQTFVLLVLTVVASCRTAQPDRATASPQSTGEPGLAKDEHESPLDAEGEARHDIAAGRLALRTYGLPAYWARDYRRLLRERLGVELRSVAGCLIDSKVAGDTFLYNRVMTEEIERRFGAGILKHLEEEAEAMQFPAPPPVT